MSMIKLFLHTILISITIAIVVTVTATATTAILQVFLNVTISIYLI